MDKQLRGIILKLQNRLSDDDRIRLHFFVGNDVPRNIRDDLSLRGTLKMMDSLIDQDKINEQDFTFLIHAFDEIQCIDAAKLLRAHLRRNQSNGVNPTVQSLSLIMPSVVGDILQDLGEDRLVTEHFLSNQQDTDNQNDNTNDDIVPVSIDDQKAVPERSKEKRIIRWSFVFWICCVLCVLLFLIGYGIGIYFNTKKSNQNSTKQVNHQSVQERKPFIKKVTNSTATVCPNLVCSIIPSVQNPSLNYQVERLDLTCSQSLSYLNITQIVQRTYDEIHAKQYQTFWNDPTNMTYNETPTQIIYNWYSLPGMHIVKESFPHFVETQFYYRSGSKRIVLDDTWQASLRSICGTLLNLSGTF